jgi:predicted phage terminase large subunit-like protein
VIISGEWKRWARMETLQAEIMAGEHTDKRYLDVADNIFSHIKAEPENMKHYTALYSVLSSMNNCAEKWRYSEVLKRYCTERIIQNKSKDANSLFKAVLLLEAQGLRLDSYMQYIELQREPEKRFWIPRRKQLEPVCRAMQKLVDGELDILSISLPPGTGKSTLEIFLHSMMIGAFPDSCSLASGHSGTLTNSIYDGVNSILSDPDYLWHDVYPAAGTIITNAKEQTIDLGKKHRFSSLTCRAIGASLTGATRCEKLLTADDLVSGIEEALSIDRLDKLWTAYTNDLKSRKKLNCKELHLATRWSVHDPIGRLQVMYADSPKAQFLVMPAVDEDGESNFNYRYGVGFDKAYFEDMKNNLDDCSWRALFMNQPIEREGLLYNEDELRRYFELPSDSPDAIISVCDTKDKGADYCVMPIAYQYGNDFYIEEIICDNNNPEIVETRLVEILLRHKVKLSRFESNSAGGKIAEKVQKEVKTRGGITRITTKYSTANKATRIIVDSPFVKEHFLFKDNSVIKNNKEYKRALGMLCSYTMAGRNAHDDVPDAFSMLADFIQSFETQTVRVIQRPY